MILYQSNLERNGLYFCVIVLFKDEQPAAGLIPDT